MAFRTEGKGVRERAQQGASRGASLSSKLSRVFMSDKGEKSLLLIC